MLGDEGEMEERERERGGDHAVFKTTTGCEEGRDKAQGR